MPDRFQALLGVIRSPTHDDDAKWEALASALEELSGKGDVGGEASPLDMTDRAKVYRLEAELRDEKAECQRMAALYCTQCGKTGEAKQRAEAAEAQLSELKRQLGAEHVRLNDTREAVNKALPEALQLLPNELWQGLPARVARLTAELESARARVGELTYQRDWICQKVAEARRQLRSGQTLAACAPLEEIAAGPPSAPTPAVVGCDSCEWVGPAEFHNGHVINGYGDEQCDGEESPPRDGGGEKHRWSGPSRIPTICWVCGINYFGSGAMAPCPGKKGPDEQRKDTSETAEAKTPEVGPVADATGAGVPGREGRDGGDRRVAPPGLTPEEAEEGARRMWNKWLKSGPLSQFDGLAPDRKSDVVAAYVLAHSEGAKAASTFRRDHWHIVHSALTYFRNLSNGSEKTTELGRECDAALEAFRALPSLEKTK